MSGDAAAWQEIVQQYHRRIYNICYRFSGSAEDAADLAQEVFIKMYRTLSTYDTSRASFMTWVTTVTRNLLVDHFRKGKYDRVTDSLDAAPGQPGGSGLTLADKLEDRRREARGAGAAARRPRRWSTRRWRRLSPELREAVILRDLQDMDYKDIAKVLNVPEGTVKSRINRGRTELARLLQRTYKQVG